MILHDAPHFLRFGLIASFSIAILAIVGIVGLTTGGGVQLTHAQNVAGAASAQPNAITYDGYDAQRKVLDFTFPPLKTPVQVGLNANGQGTLVVSGRSYAVQLVENEHIHIDTNADGAYDARLAPGDHFIVRQR